MPFIEDVLLETDAAAFDPAADVKELFEAGGGQPGGGDSFAIDSAEAVLVFVIDWRKARAFTRWALGFAYADKGYPFRLRRENPKVHPRFPKLTAATVHFSSIAPKSNTATGTWAAAPANAPNYPAVFDTAGELAKTGYYDSCYATVRFARRDHDFRPDENVAPTDQPADPQDELRRNCVVTTQPVVELLAAEGGMAQLRWSEGGGTNQPSIDAPQNVIANSFAIRVAKTKIVLNLYWWPEAYLSSDPRIFFPAKLFSCVGKVNATPFLGRPAGTLLCDAPKCDRFQFPVGTYDNLGGFFGYNIQIPLTFFDPILGLPDTNPADNDKARGWRTYPFPLDNRWYGAQREKTDDALLKWNIAEADFSKMLEHINQ